jgi:outer membrane receptor for ferrienterochelin and colicins
VPIVADLASLGLRVTLEAPRRVSYVSDELTRPAAVADLTLSGQVKRFGVGYTVGVYNVIDTRYNLPITETYFSRLSPQNGRTFLANVTVQYP